MCIRDSLSIRWAVGLLPLISLAICSASASRSAWSTTMLTAPCLLYTSPSPRDGHLSIRSAASDVYKRQLEHPLGGGALAVDLPGHLQRLGFEVGVVDDDVDCALSLIHISEPTRRTPLYSVGSVRCV